MVLCFKFVTELVGNLTDQRDTPYCVMLCSAIKMRWGVICCCDFVDDCPGGFCLVLFFLQVFNFVLNNEFLLPLPFWLFPPAFCECMNEWLGGGLAIDQNQASAYPYLWMWTITNISYFVSSCLKCDIDPGHEKYGLVSKVQLLINELHVSEHLGHSEYMRVTHHSKLLSVLVVQGCSMFPFSHEVIHRCKS